MERLVKECDVFCLGRHVHTYRVTLEIKELDGEWHKLGSRIVDLSQRGLDRLLRKMACGVISPKAAKELGENEAAAVLFEPQALIGDTNTAEPSPPPLVEAPASMPTGPMAEPDERRNDA